MEHAYLKNKLSLLRAKKIVNTIGTNGRKGTRLEREEQRRIGLVQLPIVDRTSDDDREMSDCESCTSDPSPKAETITKTSEFGLVRLDECCDKDYGVVKNGFVTSMMGTGLIGKQVCVKHVRKNMFTSFEGRAKLQSFKMFSEATARNRASNGNIKYGWYGSSKEGIKRVLEFGFGYGRERENNGVYGQGIYLSPKESSIDSVMSAIPDEVGLRHVLLCRVILGNTEQVMPGYEQFHPSSTQFDSGVDNLLSPKKYIVWNTHMNTHILPEYVISFTTASWKLEEAEPLMMQQPMMKPKSAWMPFPTLIDVLSKYLPSTSISLVQQCHCDYRDKKITRQRLIQLVREIAGDKLLASIIKTYRGKESSAATNTNN